MWLWELREGRIDMESAWKRGGAVRGWRAQMDRTLALLICGTHRTICLAFLLSFVKKCEKLPKKLF